jgi:hypothetical protein
MLTGAPQIPIATAVFRPAVLITVVCGLVAKLGFDMLTG